VIVGVFDGLNVLVIVGVSVGVSVAVGVEEGGGVADGVAVEVGVGVLFKEQPSEMIKQLGENPGCPNNPSSPIMAGFRGAKNSTGHGL
jgi:hypothetical protein